VRGKARGRGTGMRYEPFPVVFGVAASVGDGVPATESSTY
jgi:hypothetical protein